MLDESHVDLAGKQRELDLAQFVEGPALAAATRRDCLVPHCSHSFPQRLVLDPLQAGKEFGDLSDAIVGSFGCCHDDRVDLSRYF